MQGPCKLRRGRQFGQEGQSLAEFLLALPVLMMLIFGMIQIGAIAVVIAFSHYAASCALRSYTVFYPQGKGLAMERAGHAMEQAFAWCHPMPDFELEIKKEEQEMSGALADAQYNGRGPLMFRAKLTVQMPLFFALRGHDSFHFDVSQSILSEKTVETEQN